MCDMEEVETVLSPPLYDMSMVVVSGVVMLTD